MIKNKKAFTLTELLVVLALISIMLLIVIPSILLINRRINRRLLEGKKEVVLTAAELYGNDNSDAFNASGELQITVEILLRTGYLEPDKNATNCTETYGCIINPMEKDETLNDIEIMIYKKNNTFTALWDETNSGQVAEPLLNLICEKLNKEFEKKKGLTIAIGDSSQDCGCSVDGETIKLKKWNNEKTEDSEDPTMENCYFTSDDLKNWLYYSEFDFRIMGIEKIGEEFYIKMITNDNI